jgi:hypothetical protein
MDVNRLEKNFGYMARTVRNRSEEEFEAAGKAVIEQHFDNHEYCEAWCIRKRQTEQQRLATDRYYRKKTGDERRIRDAKI